MSETDNNRECPRCGNPAQDFLNLDAGIRLALQTAGETVNVPSVCHACYEELSRKVSKGVRLRAEQKAKEQNRMLLWKNRVNLIKQARALMEQKAYSEAAVSYEKYLRVLEMVYELKPGQLTPDVFSKSSRSKELTVVTSVYWDLFRIYDTSPRYGDRMAKAGKKLALFLPHSNIYPDVIKKAEAFARTAKNTAAVKELLKATRKARVRCFIATSAFGSPLAPEVLVLRDFRDQVLKRTFWGRRFVFLYYRLSPGVARFLDAHPRWRKPVRQMLRLFAQHLGHFNLKTETSS